MYNLNKLYTNILKKINLLYNNYEVDMKKFVLFIMLFMFSCNVYAQEEVKFSKCVDGDTIKVLIKNKEYTVRMLAIDTPESVHPKKKVEYYGKEASDYTCDKIKNANKLELEYDAKSDKKDKYDRILAYVFVDDYLLEDLLVTNGYAEVAYLYDDYKYADLLKDKESVAKAKGIGIWNEEERNKFNNNDVSLSIKEIILLIGLSVALYFYKKIDKKVRKRAKRYKKVINI